MAGDLPSANASPAKRFFISMLIRDIELIPAIVDLVDNSVDAARQTAESTTDLSAFHVEIVANESVSTYLLPGILPRLRQQWSLCLRYFGSAITRRKCSGHLRF